MKHPKLHIINRTLQIVTTILVFLFILAAADGIIISIVATLTYWRYLPAREIRQTKRQKLTNEDIKQQRLDSSKIRFMEDGTIHLLYNPEQIYLPNQNYTARWSKTIAGSKTQIYDVNDNLLWEGKTEDIPYQYLGWSDESVDYKSRDYDEGMTYSYNNYGINARNLQSIQSFTPDLSRTLELNFEEATGRLEFWRYCPSEDYFVGFKARGPEIGYISASGFTTSKAETRPFGKFCSVQNFTKIVNFKPAVLWQTNSRLYEIDIQTRDVNVLFESNDSDIENFSIKRFYRRSPDDIPPYLKLFNENCRPFIDCTLENKNHHLILIESLQHIPVVLPDEWSNWYGKNIEITVTKQDVFLHHSWVHIKPAPKPGIGIQFSKQYTAWYNENLAKTHILSDEFYKVNKDGSLQLISSFTRTRSGQEIRYSDEQHLTLAKSAQTFLRAFSPSLYTLAWNTFEDKILNEFRNQSTALSGIASVIIVELHPNKKLPNLLLSAAFILTALWHGWARRTSWGKLILWLIIVGAFNLAGFLSYLALNHTPTIRCPNCGKKRGLQSVACIRCGKELPIPQRKPTDLILAD